MEKYILDHFFRFSSKSSYLLSLKQEMAFISCHPKQWRGPRLDINIRKGVHNTETKGLVRNNFTFVLLIPRLPMILWSLKPTDGTSGGQVSQLGIRCTYVTKWGWKWHNMSSNFFRQRGKKGPTSSLFQQQVVWAFMSTKKFIFKDILSTIGVMSK